MHQPTVVSVILNTNRREDTLACLASLQRSDYQNHQALVLDNASVDGSVEAIHATFPHVRVLSLRENLGYAGNNNVGIHEAVRLGADWVFVLNEDTLLAPDCLSRLVEAGESNDRIGMVGPLVYHASEPTVIQSAGGTLDARWQARHIAQNMDDRGQFTRPRPVDWLSGCAIMVRRAVIDQVGALDERFFYYWEETEWCYRARRYGWQIVNVPQAKLWHKGVQRHYRPSPHVTYYNTRNRLLFMSKHHAPVTAHLAAWAQVMRTLASWSIRPRWAAMRDHRDAMWQAIADYRQQRWGMRRT